jgi:hypothetical protein
MRTGRPYLAAVSRDLTAMTFRRLLSPKAQLVHRFEAGSHREAMNLYYRFVGYGDHIPSDPWDVTPYSDEWKIRQQ